MLIFSILGAAGHFLQELSFKLGGATISPTHTPVKVFEILPRNFILIC